MKICKIISILLSVFLCMSVLAGCESGQPEQQAEATVKLINAQLEKNNLAKIVLKETLNKNGKIEYRYQSDLELAESNRKGIGVCFQFDDATKQLEYVLLAGMEERDAYNTVRSMVCDLPVLQLSKKDKQDFQNELEKEFDETNMDTRVFYVKDLEVMEIISNEFNTASLSISRQGS